MRPRGAMLVSALFAGGLGKGLERVKYKTDAELLTLASQGEESQALLDWQSSKARSSPGWVAGIDRLTERRTRAWLSERLVHHALRGKSALCVGARAGGEVRAFRASGAFAVGIDLYPAEVGNGSTLVLRGNAASLQCVAEHAL